MKNCFAHLMRLSHNASRYAVGVEGNVSCRFGNGLYIKISGRSLRAAIESDFIFCDIDGNHDSDGPKPSMEVKFHTWFYQNTTCNFVMHTHPTETMKVLCSYMAHEFATERMFPDQVVFNGERSCLIDYLHPGEELSHGIANRVMEYRKDHGADPKLILLKNHGIITIGNTIDDCIISADICEKSAAIFIGSSSGRAYLSEREIKRLINDDDEKHRQAVGDVC